MSKYLTMAPSDIGDKLEQRNRILIALAVVGLIGFLTSSIRPVGVVWALLIFFGGVFLVIKNKNINGEAHLFAGYIVGAEVFFRMTKSGLPWELGKYAMIFLLALGLLIDKKKRSFALLIVIYGILLLPAIYLTFEYFSNFSLFRKTVMFNMLGPLSLVVATLYFYRMHFSLDDFVRLSRWIVYGVFTMAVLVFFNVGSYESLEYTYASSAGASGGFSGNQVSTAFGLGILIMGVHLFLGNKIFHFVLLDSAILMLFVFQGLMSFSRGGVVGGVLSLVIALVIYILLNPVKFLDFFRKKFLLIVAGLLASIIVFVVADDITGGKLYGRYFNVDESGYKIKEDVTTGRGAIVEGDLDLFKESGYVGVGVGISPELRKEHRFYAAHVEYSRMLADHGILGLLSLIIIAVLLPAIHFFRLISSNVNRYVFVALILFSFITMTHAAMRLAVVGFFYGMAYVVIFKSKSFKND